MARYIQISNLSQTKQGKKANTCNYQILIISPVESLFTYAMLVFPNQMDPNQLDNSLSPDSNFLLLLTNAIELRPLNLTHLIFSRN